MSVTARALYPSEETVMGWNTIGDIKTWAGVSEDDWRVVAGALGDEELDTILLVAGMPPYLLTGALKTWIMVRGGSKEVDAIRKAIASARECTDRALCSAAAARPTMQPRPARRSPRRG